MNILEYISHIHFSCLQINQAESLLLNDETQTLSQKREMTYVKKSLKAQCEGKQLYCKLKPQKKL